MIAIAASLMVGINVLIEQVVNAQNMTTNVTGPADNSTESEAETGSISRRVARVRERSGGGRPDGPW